MGLHLLLTDNIAMFSIHVSRHLRSFDQQSQTMNNLSHFNTGFITGLFRCVSELLNYSDKKRCANKMVPDQAATRGALRSLIRDYLFAFFTGFAQA